MKLIKLLTIYIFTKNIFSLFQIEKEYKYKLYLKKYNKKYSNHKEYLEHYNIFKANLKLYNKINSKEKIFKLGITKFTDEKLLIFEETSKKNIKKTNSNSGNNFKFNYLKLNNKEANKYQKDNYGLGNGNYLNWNKKFSINVRNQYSCGGCYAFASSTLVSYLFSIFKKEYINWSSQQILDCTSLYGNYSCEGGNNSHSLDYIKKVGLLSNENYPFFSKNHQFQNCKMKGLLGQKFYKIKEYKIINSKNLLNYLKYSPILIRINAKYLHHYKNGIIMNIKDCDNTLLDHSLLLIGFGEENGVKYWILQNSWGENYGEKGLIRILRKDSGSQLCGLDKIPIIAKL